jgi:nucleotide-binding universal stress UspA family protein
MSRINKILVPTDGSPTAKKAEKMAVTLAEQLDGQVIFVHIIPTSVWMMPESEANVALEVKDWEESDEQDVGLVKAPLHDALGVAKKSGVKASARLYRTTFSTREAVVQVAENLKVDLIVIGTTGRSLKQIILGSVAVGVVTYAHCHVMVVR